MVYFLKTREFLRKHGFLRIVGNETPKNCRFEYPEIQDYLRARVAVGSICGGPWAFGDDDVYRRCATEQVRLVDFISLLLRWRLKENEIVFAIAQQRPRFNDLSTTSNSPAQAGLLQILLRALRDSNAQSSDVTRGLCRYFGDESGRTISNAYFWGLFSRLDLREIRIVKTLFRDVHLEHCRFDDRTVFENCAMENEFGAALSCRGLGEVDLIDCKLSNNALATFRQHKNKVGRVPIDRTHVENTCHHILNQFHIGQMGLRSKAYDDVRHQATKVSPIGEEILAELIRCGVLSEEKGGTRHSLEVKDRGAVSLFVQQSTLRGTVATAIDRAISKFVKLKQ
jgi:hypothetical protein